MSHSATDPYAHLHSRDADINAARVLMPNADPDVQGIAAFLMSKGATFEELGEFIDRARASHR